MGRLRLAQVGVGGWGWSWTQLLQDSPDWEIVAYVDVDPSVRDRVAGLGTGQWYTSLTEALDSTTIDGVLVAVPPHVHAPVAIEALDRGCHVLVEKPLADTMAEATEIVASAHRANRTLMVSQNYRFKRGVRTVRHLLGSGIIGTPGYISIAFHKAPHFPTPFRHEMEAPLARDMSIHHFDQLRSILGKEAISVRATSWNPTWSWFAGDPAFSALIRMEDNVMVNYLGSWVSQGTETTWDGDWQIEGSEGGIRWADNRVTVLSRDLFKTVFNRGLFERNGQLEAELLSMPLEERWYVLHEFAQAIREGRPAETSGDDNLYSVALTSAVIDSAHQGREVYLSEYF